MSELDRLKRENEQLKARLVVLEGLMSTSEHLFLRAPIFHSFDADTYDPLGSFPAEAVRVRLEVEWEGLQGRKCDRFQGTTYGRIPPLVFRRFVVVGVPR